MKRNRNLTSGPASVHCLSGAFPHSDSIAVLARSISPDDLNQDDFTSHLQMSKRVCNLPHPVDGDLQVPVNVVCCDGWLIFKNPDDFPADSPQHVVLEDFPPYQTSNTFTLFLLTISRHTDAFH